MKKKLFIIISVIAVCSICFSCNSRNAPSHNVKNIHIIMQSEEPSGEMELAQDPIVLEENMTVLDILQNGSTIDYYIQLNTSTDTVYIVPPTLRQLSYCKHSVFLALSPSTESSFYISDIIADNSDLSTTAISVILNSNTLCYPEKLFININGITYTGYCKQEKIYNVQKDTLVLKQSISYVFNIPVEVSIESLYENDVFFYNSYYEDFFSTNFSAESDEINLIVLDEIRLEN